MHNLPNLFVMNDPNTGLGAGSIIFIIESQIGYVLGALSYMTRHDIDVLEASSEAEEAFAPVSSGAARDRRLEGGCQIWYVDPRSGHLTTIWPDFMSRFAENGVFDPDGNLVRHRAGTAVGGLP